MAVPEQTPFIEYTANGTTTVYPLTFDCDKSEYLIVSLDGEEAPVGSWTLTGGSITFNSAPANGVLITIKRNTPFRRTTEYQSYNNSFRPSPVNKDFDLIWWKLQELGVTDSLTDEDVKNLNIYVDSLNEETRNDFFDKLGQLEQNTNAMLEEAIANGAVSALAITTVNSLSDLDDLNKWDGRTVYVKNVANFRYSASQAAWVLASNSSEALVDPFTGNNQKDINDLSAFKLVSIFDFMTMDQFKTWKSNQETFNVTFALQAALNAPGISECLLPSGKFLYSGVYCDKHNFKLYSNAGAILLSDDSANVAFHIAKFSEYIQGVQLDGLVFQGNANTLRGVQLGSGNKAAIFTKIRNCTFTGFSKDDACDIYLGSVQELDIQDTRSWNGNIGIYKAADGYGTSTRIHGKKGYFGRHNKHGIKMDGQIDDIYVQDSIFEGNGLEAIYINDTAFKVTQGVTMHIQNAYFESNGNSGAGEGAIYAKGKPEYLKLHRIFSLGCNFAANLNAPANFKNVAGSNIAVDVSGTSNLLPNMIGLTNSWISYNANLTVSAGDIFQQLKDLEAAGNKVISTGFNYLRAYQNSKNAQANFLSSITFPSAAVLSTDTTTLDDYREVSTFVPVVTGNGGTVSAATCRYTKIGNLVNFEIQLTTANFTSTQGTTKVSLPHTQVVGTVATFMNNQTYAGGFALIASQSINLPTLASQGSAASIYIAGSYLTTS
ncbi:DUF2460 domain-containing protein [Acinetobacter baumannii]|uniref:hypothetical protein n=1 Tax=Acinetobacter baumannii TaxID=470 RepID=UPI0022EAA57B|nr:hypothetical protein [Acinetobacter baumannii]MDA3358780.1 DUF2460 domain-containing protein [Acinetobacter baumannii]WFQ20450.1 hypothetical protein P9J63_12505 [Acinetobacter baumannii]WFQ24073.1 hypothetical protein P9J61_12490 [Acinetobacter baumannii]WFQ27710.1 hypothetical protein P9J59_12500 [Acinetobacter baumannii]